MWGLLGRCCLWGKSIRWTSCVHSPRSDQWGDCSNSMCVKRSTCYRGWSSANVFYDFSMRDSKIHKTHRPTIRIMLFGSCHLILFVSSTNYFQSKWNMNRKNPNKLNISVFFSVKIGFTSSSTNVVKLLGWSCHFPGKCRTSCSSPFSPFLWWDLFRLMGSQAAVERLTNSSDELVWCWTNSLVGRSQWWCWPFLLFSFLTQSDVKQILMLNKFSRWANSHYEQMLIKCWTISNVGTGGAYCAMCPPPPPVTYFSITVRARWKNFTFPNFEFGKGQTIIR